MRGRENEVKGEEERKKKHKEKLEKKPEQQ
jgi:hypothetical protein